ncbi:MAG: cyclic nucleotide-binding domain-containing protein [Verrucomicrobiae bacterium]|nr:cyclic nucleotide-binding domain-containing protein [Verrucomicrobiae bacterium]
MAAANKDLSALASAPPAPLPPALLEQYLDALLAGHPPPEAHKTSVDFGLLHAIASPDTVLLDKARRVLQAMNVMDRWRLARLVDEVANPARALVKERFAPFQVGLLSEDFAGTPARDYPAGTRLFAAGEEAHEAFLVESGRVLISKNGRPVVHLGRHEFFGNLPFLLPVQRTADAFALEPTRVRVLSKEAYLAKFTTYAPQRQADELKLACVMLRQLISGLARYDSTVKVLADHLFPEMTRHEQAEALQRWMEHFTQGAGFGEAKLYGLFNLLELLDRELLLLAHLDHAGAEAVAKVRQQQGILRGVAVGALRRAPEGLEVFARLPQFLRLADTGASCLPAGAPPLEVVCLPGFLWPDTGSRHAAFKPEDAQALLALLTPQSWVYLAAPPGSSLLPVLRKAGLFAGMIVPGLYALSPSEPPRDLPPPEASPVERQSAKGWREKLQRWWRK